MCIYIYIGKEGGHRSVAEVKKLICYSSLVMRLMEWRGRRETEGKKSLSLLLKPSSRAVNGSEMSDCTAGLLVFRECFAAFRDLILHCLRRRAASRCRRHFPPLCLVHPGSLFPSRIRGRGNEDCRARGENKTH